MDREIADRCSRCTGLWRWRRSCRSRSTFLLSGWLGAHLEMRRSPEYREEPSWGSFGIFAGCPPDTSEHVSLGDGPGEDPEPAGGTPGWPGNASAFTQKSWKKSPVRRMSGRLCYDYCACDPAGNELLYTINTHFCWTVVSTWAKSLLGFKQSILNIHETKYRVAVLSEELEAACVSWGSGESEFPVLVRRISWYLWGRSR